GLNDEKADKSSDVLKDVVSGYYEFMTMGILEYQTSRLYYVATY
nr:hypothetical protein [Tanacetum cinerariifolium]